MRRYGPKKPGDPTLGRMCPACRKPFEEGDYTALVELGPGDDQEAQKKARLGLPYNAVAVEVHFACAGGR